MFAETCLQWQKQQQKHFHFQLHCLGFENLQKLQQKKQCIFDYMLEVYKKIFVISFCRLIFSWSVIYFSL